ncbi:hypothetical protein ACQEVF_09530 [Nonomuraea polychroma]|uniref:hypothetical protein n=1 Tax=Nonomuraea polychroma TaxID=46176 RepID=UPI003D8F1F1D
MSLRRAGRFGTAAIVAALTATAPAFPATASTAPDLRAAMAACRQDAGGASTSLHLSPNRRSVYVGSPGGPLQTQIRRGAAVRVTATGKISYGGLFNWRGTWGPKGNGDTAPNSRSWPFPGGPDAALVGLWNHAGTNVRIGADSGCMLVPKQTIATAPYGLWLSANDDDISDNGDKGYDIRVRAWLIQR